MANGYNPYNVVGTQQGLLENLLQSEQKKKQGEMAGGVHRGEMGEQFQTEQIAAQKEQERLLQKQRKPGFLEQITPLLGLIPGVGTIASATLSGLNAMYKAKQQSKFAQKQIGKARGAGLDNKWGGTFLGGEAREAKAEQDTMLDQMLEQTKVSGGDLLKTGLTEGIKGWAMGKVGEGIGETAKGVKTGEVVTGEAAKGLKEMTKEVADAGVDMSKESLDELSKNLAENPNFEVPENITNLADKMQMTKEELVEQLQGMQGKQTLMQSLFGAQGAFGKDPSTLLDSEGKGGNVMKNLMMIQSLIGDRE